MALTAAALAHAQGGVSQDAKATPSPPPPPERPAPASLLVIMAHPDDEITIAPVIARVAREGGAVTLIQATSGDAGPGTSGLKPGETLAALREEEGRCAAKALGIADPVYWNMGDGELATMARAPDSNAMRALDLTRKAMAEHRPELVITWGPDGGYGHADHRIISNIVTQVAAQMGPQRPELLYAAFPRGPANALPGFERWGTTTPDLLTDRIAYSPQDLEAAQSALACYETQFPASARQGLMSVLDARVWSGAIPFRRAF